MRRSPYCARSCFVPFWPDLRWSRSREVGDLGWDGAGGRPRGRDRRSAVGRTGGARLVDRGSEWEAAAFRGYRVRERKLLEIAGHATARPLSATRVDDDPGLSQCRAVDTSGERRGAKALSLSALSAPHSHRRGGRPVRFCAVVSSIGDAITVLVECCFGCVCVQVLIVIEAAQLELAHSRSRKTWRRGRRRC